MTLAARSSNGAVVRAIYRSLSTGAGGQATSECASSSARISVALIQCGVAVKITAGKILSALCFNAGVRDGTTYMLEEEHPSLNAFKKFVPSKVLVQAPAGPP